MDLQAWKACVLGRKENVSETNVIGLDPGSATGFVISRFSLSALRFNFSIYE